MEHFLDADEPDADGLYSYYYEGDLYRFHEDGQTMVVKTYTDEPHVGYVRGIPWGTAKPSPFLAAVIRHLAGCGVQELRWFTPNRGYQPWSPR